MYSQINALLSAIEDTTVGINIEVIQLPETKIDIKYDCECPNLWCF